jgi:hypothetical protein
MTGKGDRTVAPRIMYVLEENKGVGMRFSEIFRALAKHGWLHNQNPISSNLKFLIEQGKVAKVESQYAIIKAREDGTKFVIVKNPVEKVIELE